MKGPSLAVLRFGEMSFRWHPRTILVCCALVALALLLGVVLLGTGALSFTPAEVIASLTGAGDNQRAERVILRIRLPRVLTALLVGSALGMAGSIFQSISRNALGSPDIVGFTTGAATGAIVQIVLFNAGPVETSLAAVLSGGATALLVFLLSLKGRTTGGYRLVLIGIGVGAVLSGFNTVLLVMGDLDQAAAAQLWLAGSLNTRTWSHVVPAACSLTIALPAALYHARRLTILEMGDDTASQLGISVERTRLVMVLVAVWLTATATAAAGPIAFIALVGPQVARRLTGSPAVPIVSGALTGAVLLLAADLVGQRLPLNLNMPVGLTTGFLGGLYLLWLLAKSKNV
ncbi:ABC transporter permease (plasmid) [Rhizobium sp. ACO-34A]|nr:iron chelate uptake ABC transporter family permease subunit [Rhizobium sp. ACO-34A]ATN36626.1 ABC transporter permease [Rhizobium sp. ACO-34A]